MGVWIETCWISPARRKPPVTPYVGVWIETLILNNLPVRISCHTLRGCVDWNQLKKPLEVPPDVTPYVGVWIETACNMIRKTRCSVTPYVGVWIETSKSNCSKKRKPSHTLRGCVDWNINGPVFGNIEDGHTLRGNIWIGALFTRRSSLWKNCKHSASYVFLSRLLILLWLEKTRTSPNAYLLSVFFCCFT